VHIVESSTAVVKVDICY